MTGGVAGKPLDTEVPIGHVSGLPVGETMKWPATKPATARLSRVC